MICAVASRRDHQYEELSYLLDADHDDSTYSFTWAERRDSNSQSLVRTSSPDQ
jgi:hypothetical protein